MINTLKSGAARKLYAKKRILEICQKYNFNVRDIIGICREKESVQRRAKVAVEMFSEGFSKNIIAYVMNRDHSTIGNYFREKK